MNKVPISILTIFLLYGTGLLIGTFFGINMIYTLPIIGWFIALILFYLILDNKHKNMFMEKLNEMKKE
tara:strand:- start:2659 stop:2862 length:204 start_codon:yes stop_codon:yes gene_type:complete